MFALAAVISEFVAFSDWVAEGQSNGLFCQNLSNLMIGSATLQIGYLVRVAIYPIACLCTHVDMTVQHVGLGRRCLLCASI